MALDLVQIRTLVDQLDNESAEAIAAQAVMAERAGEAVAAAQAAQMASDDFARENGEKVAKLQELILLLQNAIAED